ncbi:hypothetical protein [Tsuneonella amylolytica]|uniref:hypothetical protein n=1 Tax=Tsuneonella amylolytica TaxID=2338327 RepID=UPI000EA9F4C0|nr:hypothetical protein [Tsuneonella amylolytica]
MKKKLALFAPVAALAAVVGTAVAAQVPAEAWSIGPVIKGRNYSVGMPSTLQPTRDGPSFAFPGPSRANGHVHAVTFPVRSLEGASRLTLTYRIDAAPGTRFYGQENGGPGWLSLFFQQRGDNWTARGPYETYRWYSPNNRISTLKPGTHTVTVDLDEEWNAVVAWKRSANPAAFNRALANADKVGFVFGSSSGLGHGVYATAPARFTIIDYRIE